MFQNLLEIIRRQLARMTSHPDGTSPESHRQPGGWQGRVTVAEDFDDPLPESLVRAFEGGDEPSSAGDLED